MNFSFTWVLIEKKHTTRFDVLIRRVYAPSYANLIINLKKYIYIYYYIYHIIYKYIYVIIYIYRRVGIFMPVIENTRNR